MEFVDQLLDGCVAHVGDNMTYIAELDHSNTSPTHNKFFDDNGYLILKGICDPDILYHPVPEERGQLLYRGDDVVEHLEDEKQVSGSLARWKHPQYKLIHKQLRPLLESVIGRKLYETYYYDRFYFPGQELVRHTDRSASEISISVHVSTNIVQKWPFWIKTPDIYDYDKGQVKEYGRNVSVNLDAGDGVLYKGCERPHWRDEMPGLLETELATRCNKEVPQFYYHQIFFHYVLQDGIRAHYAWDVFR